MADKTIGDLTQAESIGNEDLFVLEQGGEAKKLKGARLVKYAQDTVGAQVTVATEAAESAETAKTGAESAQTQAQAARDAILNMLVEAITLEQGSPATVEKSIVGSVYKLTFGLPSGKKGDPGATGPANTLTIGTVTSGIEASATITGEAPNQVLNLVLKQGDKGNPGDNAPTITGITIRQSDYHMIVTLSDGTSYDAGYCRGAAGAGTGDMLASTYDPQGKAQDIFAYIDNAVSGVTVTTDATPTQGSTNPVQSGGVYTALANKLDKTGDGSNVTAAFTATSSRTNIATGEKLSVLFGKIAKWFSDLGSLAFKSTVAKTDLASDVQTSLGKADSALQSVTKSDVGLGNVDNVKQYSSSNPPPYPVTSVNGQTGAVTVQSGSEAASYTATLTATLSVNDCFVFSKCEDASYGSNFSASPNTAFWGFADNIIEDVCKDAVKFYTTINDHVAPIDVDGYVHDAIKAVTALLNDIVADAAQSGTWMDEGQLWETEAWRVIGMANATRSR